jgi:thiol-disulfide isomerase/thioredoxin
MRSSVLLCTLLGVLMVVPSVHAQIAVQGTLVGADGAPMPRAHVVVDEGPTDTTIVAATDASGRFTLRLPTPGGYGLYAMGIHHRTQEFPLVVTDREPVELDIQLRAADFRDAFDQARVIGDFNDFSTEEDAVSLSEQADGTLTATVEINDTILAYQLLGVQQAPGGRPAPVAGTQADRYAFDDGGPFWDVGSEYTSVLDDVTGGEVTITFDPSQLPRARGSFALRSGREPVERIVDIYLDVEQRERGRPSASDRDVYRQRIAQEQDPLVRQWMLLRYFDELNASAADSMLARQALREVPPTSPFWSFEAWSNVGASNLIFSIARRAQAPSQVHAYMDQGIAEHPDSDVRRHFLYAAVYRADREGNESTKWRYYDELMANHSTSYQAERLRRDFSKERAIQAGRSVPDFSFTALEDSSVTYTDDELCGKVYLIDFWGTWCGPCIEEMPHLQKAYETYRDQGFEMLSVAFIDTRADIQQFRANRYPMPWRHTLVSSDDARSVRTQFEITGFPRPILVDETGTIIAVDDALRGDKLFEQVARAVDGRE